jgi:uncharacterized OB-fold protein
MRPNAMMDQHHRAAAAFCPGRICSCCGAVVLDGHESCAAMFNTVLEREYSNSAFGEAHLFTVDAYAFSTRRSTVHAPTHFI